MGDGYVLIRQSTLTWLLEVYRNSSERPPVTDEVAVDLRGAVTAGLRAPVPEVDRLRVAGPILSAEQHLQLLREDEELSLPRDRQSAAFWETVLRVTHRVLSNEAEAVLRLIGEGEQREGQ